MDLLRAKKPATDLLRAKKPTDPSDLLRAKKPATDSTFQSSGEEIKTDDLHVSRPEEFNIFSGKLNIFSGKLK